MMHSRDHSVGNILVRSKIHNGGITAKPKSFANHRDKVDAQARTPDVLMSNITGIIQKDGTICETSDILGAEDMGESSQGLMLHVNHGKVPRVSQSWLRKYQRCSTSQIGALCDVTELDRYSVSAQRNENVVISVADQTYIKSFLATCFSMKDMADAPGSSKAYGKYLNGSRSTL